MTQRTHRNLNVTIHAEAFASAKYKRYAAFSRSNENEAFAKLLTTLADDSRMYNFAEELKLSGMVGDDLANLRDLLQEIQYDVERYRQFAIEAKNDGDESASLLFTFVMHKDESLAGSLERTIDANLTI